MPHMYILECENGKYYTGSTKNLPRRLNQHFQGEGANFTRKHKPIRLVYSEEFKWVQDAFYREKQIQGWSHAKKKALIELKPETLHALAECQNETKAPFDYAQGARFDYAQGAGFDYAQGARFDCAQRANTDYAQGAHIDDAQRQVMSLKREPVPTPLPERSRRQVSQAGVGFSAFKTKYNQSMQRKKLPIGIQTFREIREENYYYVDKTPFVLQLAEQGKHYFLSRPRRFGKSLFLDTLKELFEGNRQLFEGLYADTHWDWSVKYPVIRISFGGGVHKQLSSLEAAIYEQISGYEASSGLTPQVPGIPSRFKRLIQHLHAQNNLRVVVLIDEYDKPILDNLTDPAIARELREALRSFYSVLKDNDAHLKFVFITGVSKFSKVSLFSGLNNLKDLTVDKRYSALCGYTEQDVEVVFAAELPDLDRAKIRAWYNGYNWGGEAVYNPFDLLLYFDCREFRSFWFETGTPTFLVDFLAEHKWFTPDLLQRESSDSMLSCFDVEQIAPEALLWQTGYLTFHKVEQKRSGNWIYTLSYPNREVESALNDALLPAYGPEAQPALVSRSHLEDALYNHDLDALHQSLHALFASIPYEWYRRNPLAQFEGHYASVFYSQLAALGLNVQPEDITNKGRIDLSLRLGQRVYLFEFKVVEDQATGEALQQLRDKAYAEKYRAPDVEITLIGIEFSRKERNIVGFETAS